MIPQCLDGPHLARPTEALAKCLATQMVAEHVAPPLTGKPRWVWASISRKRSALKVGSSTSAHSKTTGTHGISVSHIDNLNLVSNIEARRSAWLYELWYQQSFFGGAMGARVGQLGADEEFMIATCGGWFINAAFGWPTLPSVDLPAGGPAGLDGGFHPTIVRTWSSITLRPL
jgi:hypothetical protein